MNNISEKFMTSFHFAVSERSHRLYILFPAKSGWTWGSGRCCLISSLSLSIFEWIALDVAAIRSIRRNIDRYLEFDKLHKLSVSSTGKRLMWTCSSICWNQNSRFKTFVCIAFRKLCKLNADYRNRALYFHWRAVVRFELDSDFSTHSNNSTQICNIVKPLITAPGSYSFDQCSRWGN